MSIKGKIGAPTAPEYSDWLHCRDVEKKSSRFG